MQRSTGKDYDAMLECAILHYEKDLDQIEIATKLKVSQSQVSRLLKKAREEGIIQVSVQRYSFKDLEDQMKESFGLRDVKIVQSSEDESKKNADSLTRMLGIEAANYFESVVIDGGKIGLSGGQTMYEFVNALSLPPLHLEVYPLVAWGSPDFQIQHMHASSLVAMWWSKYRDTEAYRIDMPACKSNKKKLTKALSDTKRKIVNIDYLITSVGHMEEGSTFVELVESLGYPSIELKKLGAVGDFTGHPIDVKGNSLKRKDIRWFRNCVVLPLTLSRIVGMAADQKQYVILVAGGEKKIDSIAAALRGRLFNILITDSQVAKVLLDMRSVGRL